MGFLDHSTNNIIIDAVLTNYGRQKLADNNGKFEVSFFSLADDEVDYRLVEQYGRTVGKEKITKNTPVFEAQTASNIALKYRMLTLASQTVLYLPSISITGLNNNALVLTRAGQTPVTLTAKLSVTNGSVPDGATDQSYTLFLPDRFVEFFSGAGGSTKPPISVDPVTRVAQYSINNPVIAASDKSSTVSFDLRVKSSVSDNDFVIFGNGSTITTVGSLVGDSSGTRADFTITINKNA